MGVFWQMNCILRRKERLCDILYSKYCLWSSIFENALVASVILRCRSEKNYVHPIILLPYGSTKSLNRIVQVNKKMAVFGFEFGNLVNQISYLNSILVLVAYWPLSLPVSNFKLLSRAQTHTLKQTFTWANPGQYLGLKPRNFNPENWHFLFYFNRLKTPFSWGDLKKGFSPNTKIAGIDKGNVGYF